MHISYRIGFLFRPMLMTKANANACWPILIYQFPVVFQLRTGKKNKTKQKNNIKKKYCKEQVRFSLKIKSSPICQLHRFHQISWPCKLNGSAVRTMYSLGNISILLNKLFAVPVLISPWYNISICDIAIWILEVSSSLGS
jgi:hypothetical protein